GHVHFAGSVGDLGGAGVNSVEVFNGTTSLGLATVTGNTWSLDTTLAPGPYSSLKGVATDLAGNATTATNAQPIIVDQTNPTDSFPTVTLTVDSGSSATDYVTNDGHVHFAGSVGDLGGAGVNSVEVFNGTTSLGLATVTGNTWSLDTTLAPGTYSSLKVVATDLAGNATTATNAQPIIVDQTNPTDSFPTVTLTVDSGSSATDYVTNDGHVHFAGSVGDLGGAGVNSVEVFNGTTSLGLATVTGNTWSLDTTLAPGTYSSLKVVATDLAGNSTTATNAKPIIVDHTNPTDSFPTVTLTVDSGSSAADYVTNDGHVHFAGSVGDLGGAGGNSVEG